MYYYVLYEYMTTKLPSPFRCFKYNLSNRSRTCPYPLIRIFSVRFDRAESRLPVASLL